MPLFRFVSCEFTTPHRRRGLIRDGKNHAAARGFREPGAHELRDATLATHAAPSATTKPHVLIFALHLNLVALPLAESTHGRSETHRRVRYSYLETQPGKVTRRGGGVNGDWG